MFEGPRLVGVGADVKSEVELVARDPVRQLEQRQILLHHFLQIQIRQQQRFVAELA